MTSAPTTNVAPGISADVGVQAVRRSGPRLLIVRPSALGDVFRTAPSIATLRRAFPDAHIDCLVQCGLEEALAYHPDVDGVVPFSRWELGRSWHRPRRLKEIWDWGSSLRRSQYDLVVDLQGLARSGLMTWLTRAPRRVGFANAREMAWLFYNRRHHADMSLHHIDRCMRLLEAEGFEPVRDVRLYVGVEDDRWCDSLLREQRWGGEGFACLAPTSRWLCKCWPIERFIEIGRRLIDSGLAGGRVVVLHAPSERAYIEPLIEALRNQPGPAGADVVMTPTTTVGQLMALINRCSLVLCNDSAVAHAAAGFDKPMACIFGPTDPALIGPYGRPDAVLRPPTHAGIGSLGFYRKMGDDQTLISKLTVDDVWTRIGEQLAG